jgi:hypothetical protein
MHWGVLRLSAQGQLVFSLRMARLLLQPPERTSGDRPEPQAAILTVEAW